MDVWDFLNKKKRKDSAEERKSRVEGGRVVRREMGGRQRSRKESISGRERGPVMRRPEFAVHCRVRI